MTITPSRDPIFSELDALIASEWANTPRIKIPPNWREIEPCAYDLRGLVEESHALPEPSNSLGSIALHNERVRVKERKELGRRGPKPGVPFRPRMTHSERLAVQCEQMRQRVIAKRRKAA